MYFVGDKTVIQRDGVICEELIIRLMNDNLLSTFITFWQKDESCLYLEELPSA